ncbi:hypothetical protein A2774_03140 [Candidatus Roizmanbacteria bacterium RIFCSPHIGHO2_01_FULL_39_12c]|uniref:Proteasome subunit beta n=1 Tax=Candidatus Roizmanbacteria bacterium RIFCSPHIGHO2_01_FULL_39_12c TaxID=1802031 RepID=A0A1F7GDA3_9BACT|nr:MAG: hypothetical protein A2774_03140 [Candidatus Roizmanbacteria bacterium RIFCSPHIGHO2_01_FULL_39_12c]
MVLASDSRASSFLTSNDTVKKIFKLDEHNAVGIAGDGPLAMHFFDTISSALNFRNGISNLAEQLRNLGKEKFNDFFSHQDPKDRPSLTIILAGYLSKDDADNKGQIYTLSSNDNFVPRKSPTGFECIGIPIIANYLLNRLYEPTISSKHAAELAAFCIKETSSQDNRVGGPTQIATFSNSKGYSELSLDEIEKIEKKCDQFRLLQKGNFYPEDISKGSTSLKKEKKEK